VTVTESSPEIVSATAAQALFEEARRLRRARRCRWSVAGLLVILAVVAAVRVIDRTGPRLRHPVSRGDLPRWTSAAGAPRKTPTTYVTGDDMGGIGLYSTATGKLIHTISPEQSGELDQEAMLTGNRNTVYFAQQDGPCSGVILRVRISGAGDPSAAISIPGTMALDPSPSPTSSELAWVGDTCGASETVTATTLYLTNLATHLTTQLGSLGSIGDARIAWSRNGTQIAVENGDTIEILAANRMVLGQAKPMEVANGCRLSSPAFLSRSNQLAVIRYCWSSAGKPSTSTALVFNVATGKPMARIASAPHSAAFQGLSVDRTGTHILLGIAGPAGATTVEFTSGRLKTVSSTSPTDAEW